MENNSVIVTALYDINRENNGDGRKFSQYLDWAEETLKLNSNFVVYADGETIKELTRRIGAKPSIYYIESLLENSPLFALKPQIESIIYSEEYRNKIQHPNRIECILPEYGILQYSKFHWLKDAIDRNLFSSTHFYWADCGLSRHFNCKVDESKVFPSQDKLTDKFLIQGNINTGHIPIDDNYLWKSDCVVVGSLFGGAEDIVEKVCDLSLDFLQKDMLDKGLYNNEQLCLAHVAAKNPELFDIYIDLSQGDHLPLFRHVSNMK